MVDGLVYWEVGGYRYWSMGSPPDESPSSTAKGWNGRGSDGPTKGAIGPGSTWMINPSSY